LSGVVRRVKDSAGVQAGVYECVAAAGEIAVAGSWVSVDRRYWVVRQGLASVRRRAHPARASLAGRIARGAGANPRSRRERKQRDATVAIAWTAGVSTAYSRCAGAEVRVGLSATEVGDGA
jgi:hypothetical protein